MDDLERDLSELLERRVAGMPDQYEATPALVARARRRRALKRMSLVVSVVVIAAGTAAGVAEVSGRQHPHRIVTTPGPTTPSTTVPPTSSTSNSSTSSSTSTSGAVAATVPTVTCPVTYAITSSNPLPAPSPTPRAVPGVPAAAVAGLASYAATTDPRYVVLGPKGWACVTTIATDGQNGVSLSNPALGAPHPYFNSGPVQVLDDYLWHGGVGSTLACSVFDDPAIVNYMTANFPELVPCPKARRSVTRVDENVATFVDPDGTRGVGIMVLPTGNQDDGKLSVLTCTPTTGLTAADCDTIVADFEARVRAELVAP